MVDPAKSHSKSFWSTVQPAIRPHIGLYRAASVFSPPPGEVLPWTLNPAPLRSYLKLPFVPHRLRCKSPSIIRMPITKTSGGPRPTISIPGRLAQPVGYKYIAIRHGTLLRMADANELQTANYQALAEFRYQIRSEERRV